MSRMKKAGAIIRVSTARQLDGTSPDKQIEAIQALATNQGYELLDVHTWQLAESGGSRDRAGFHEALRAAELGEINRVYVFNIDRLGRNLLEMLLFLRNLDDLGIDCWSAERNQQLRGDDFLFQIEGAVASKERQEIIKRTQDGLHRAIKGGKYSGGIIPYGYKLNPISKQLEVDEKESEVIRLIFMWSAEEKLSCVEIAERLNAMNFPTRYTIDGRGIKRTGKRDAEKTTGLWRAGRVLNMMNNTAYMGIWQWGKRSKKRTVEERIDGYCPAIVSEDTFQKAKEVIQSNNKFGLRNTKGEYLLRGLIKCGICGRTYSATYFLYGSQKDRKQYFYKCNGRSQWRKLGTPNCKTQSLDVETLDNIVWEDVKNYCKNPHIAIQQLSSQRQPFDESNNDKLKQIDQQLEEFKSQEKNLVKIAISSKEMDIVALDEMLAENRKSIKVLVAYKKELESEKAKNRTFESEMTEIASWLSKLRDRIDQATFEEKRMAVLALVKSIVVDLETVGGKKTSKIKVIYRFGEPTLSENSSQISALNHTPARAVIMGIYARLVPVQPRPSQNIKKEYPVLYWTELTSMLRYRA
jgi:site-specific DNA recombinase